MEAAILAFKLNKLRDFYHILTKIMHKSSSKDQVDSVIEDMRKFDKLQKKNFEKA